MSVLGDRAPLTVAVLAGGRSSEHEVSKASAASVRDGLLAGGHRVLWIEIGRDGTWRHELEPLELLPGGGLLDADVVFPVLHGPFGEDGSLQGLLEVLDVAYVGSGVAASAVCIDKVLFKDLMSTAEVPQVRYLGLRRERLLAAPAQALEELAGLGLPVFVKPAHQGSSMGIAKVDSAGALPEALEAAFAFDELVIVEAMAGGLEVECGVLQELPGDAATPRALASEPGEIVLAGGWYDFDAKYAPGGMELLVPARITDTARARVQELALLAFERSGCSGLARVDFFVDGDEVLLNELNTMPGFTPTSVYARLWEASGVPYAELVERLCRLGIERHRRLRAYSY